MKIAECIAMVDKLKPNHHDTEIKIIWLSKLDGQIFTELISSHERDDNTPACFVPYTEEDMEKSLLVPYPYDDDVYTNYLMAMMNRADGEDQEYNQSMALYNNAYSRYQSQYTRTHMPLHRGRFRF